MMEPVLSLPQHHYRHSESPLCALDHGPLAGLRHRTLIDGQTGARGLALWQEEHLPGFHVPLHCHDCEEIISVIDGAIEAHLGERTFVVQTGCSILIPEWAPHGFTVISAAPVRLFAIFSSPTPGIFRPDGTPSIPPWMGGSSGHLSD